MLEIGAPRDAQARLPVIIVRSASWNQTIGLQAASRRLWVRDGSTFEGSRLLVVTQSIVHGNVSSELPGVLSIDSINIVDRIGGSRAQSDCELRRALAIRLRKERIGAGTGRKVGVFPIVRLLIQSVDREVADVRPELEGMAAPGPRQIIDILEAVLIIALRAAEVRSYKCVRQSLCRQCTRCQGRQ